MRIFRSPQGALGRVGGRCGVLANAFQFFSHGRVTDFQHTVAQVAEGLDARSVFVVFGYFVNEPGHFRLP
ncbi:hypothetical protein BCEP27_30659 [Burkholderia cepacia]